MVALFTERQRALGVDRLAQRGIDRVLPYWWCGPYTDRSTGESYDGWYSPVFDPDGKPLTHDGKPVKSWKNAGKSGPHDIWINYPKVKPYILQPKSVKRAIAAASGVLHGAEGKADTASLWATGVDNALGFFGSSFVPDSLAADLLGWGVTRFNYYCHPDALKVAQRIVDLLDPMGIDAAIYLLPSDEAGRKSADLNDIWQAVGFSAGAFWARLAELQRQALQAQPVKVYKRPAVTSRGTGDYRPYALKALADEVAALAGTKSHRNDQLYKSAAALAEFIPHGLLTESEIDGALTPTARQIGLTEGATRATIRSGIDDGKTQPRDLSHLDRRPAPLRLLPISFTKQYPSEAANQADIRQAETPAIACDAQPWPESLPKVLDAVWREFKLAKSALVLLLAVLKAIAVGDLDPDRMTRKQIAVSTGLTENQIENALEKDQGIVFRFSAYDLPSQDGVSLSKAENREIPTAAKKPGRPNVIYALNTVWQIRQNVLDRIISPRLKMRHFPIHDLNRYAEPDSELLKAAELPADKLDLLLEHIVYPAGNVAALKAYNADLNRWRFALNDFEPMHLPSLPDDMPITNGKRLNAAKVIAAAMPHVQGKISIKNISRAVGVSERAVTDLLPFAGVGMRSNFVEMPGLPDPSYNHDLAAMPAKLEYVDVQGEIKTVPYCEYAGTDEKHRPVYKVTSDAAQIAQSTLAAGRRATVLGRQAGTPYQMTNAEREQALLDIQAKKNKSSDKGKTNVKTSIVAPRFDEPGYAPEYARTWRERLPADIARSLEPVTCTPRSDPEREPITEDVETSASEPLPILADKLRNLTKPDVLPEPPAPDPLSHNHKVRTTVEILDCWPATNCAQYG